ncbi:TerB family tellurite resistance protein [Alteromonas mediterranea]|uniref:tellurite resistance TerB family protein n=1 Tax=Alteromonas mediterranea TaxID=314275 RepID=UPI0011310E4A|nr:TerB family tellurite resistance protein [Alteromonas mediterranea]QDG37902.1 TerB family tellurite resistance protein [Alteromonas mediterranea]
MLKSFLKLFEDSHKQNEPAYTVELATAALLSEIVNADNQVTETEREEYEKQLRKHVNVDDDAMTLLLKRGQETADDAVDLVHFTQVLNKHCNADERVRVVKSLWSIAYADESLAPLEESTIRQIADLLYVPHSQYIKTKLEVVENTQ